MLDFGLYLGGHMACSIIATAFYMADDEHTGEGCWVVFILGPIALGLVVSSALASCIKKWSKPDA